jgi:hypothetical protein
MYCSSAALTSLPSATPRPTHQPQRHSLRQPRLSPTGNQPTGGAALRETRSVRDYVR